MYGELTRVAFTDSNWEGSVSYPPKGSGCINWRKGSGGYRTGAGEQAYTWNYLIMDSSLQSSYHSNELEPRPKSKFFSLLIYAGYPA